MNKRDVFPSTAGTWIDERLSLGPGGRAELNRHVMEIYSLPLRVYFLGTRDRRLGDADEIVAGFFASRLDRKDFLPRWRESGLQLRRWLMNGFCYYLHEYRREIARTSSEVSLPPDRDPPANDVPPEVLLDREYLVSVVRSALAATRVDCEQSNQSAHWQAFSTRYIDEQDISSVAAAHGLSPARTRVMIRTVRLKMRQHVRNLVSRDCGRNDFVDKEILALLETIS